ncbi:hypothetical protein Rhopal_003354-T1 [Rhodotorula paludigena]|uniref:Alpha/beta hydrolase fold-3 domain-containing protein n=1 Tax=Rhodotorula paludigena TaxID=86838 RepID=A0AAV5GLF3_9BASI|nr:hypothetical protein Rhopal_003354-T1 [Rhodotorula paludigena]
MAQKARLELVRVLVLPARLLVSHVLLRWRSRIVQQVGRTALAEYLAKAAQFILSRLHVAQARIIFNRTRSYELVRRGPAFRGARDWVTRVEVNGTAGRWIATPGTQRKSDDVVLYFIHGGGFVLDTGANAQDFLLHVVKDLKAKQGVQASVFCLDYRLAPEYKYPSQLIETLAGYHYLVNTLGISETKIAISGDSAGGNLAAAFLLHLARPCDEIRVPAELGATPKSPAGAFLISPFVNLASTAPSMSRNPQFDFIDAGGAFRAACDYIGISPPPAHRPTMPGLNPLWHFRFPHQPAPCEGERLAEQWGWKHCEGVERFNDPYVNPCVQKEGRWWKEAMPGDGKTIVTWGGKEIFADDDEAFFRQLEKAGVKPQRLVKQYGAHDWVLHDFSVPTVWRTNAKGAEADPCYGANAAIDLLLRVANEAKESKGYEVGDAAVETESYAAAAKVEAAGDAPVVAEGEGDVLARSMGASGVMVDRPDQQ